MDSAMPPPNRSSLPAVGERLVMPEAGYEIEDGMVQYVAPVDELHGSRHSKLSALLEAHAKPEFDVAIHMLTRTSEIDDFAPDASVFPRERDPETGRRQLEHLAFEVVSTKRLDEAGTRAKKLMGRGVRRVLAVDVQRQRVLEWSTAVDGWQMQSNSGAIEDLVFVIPLPIKALVTDSTVDDAMAEALLAKCNRAIETRHAASRSEGKLEGIAQSILLVLRAREIRIPDYAEQQILSCSDLETLERWVSAAATATSIDEMLQSLH